MLPGPGIDAAAIDVVVFDIGGVFLIPHHEPIRSALATAGIGLAADEDAFHRAHHVGVHAIAAMVRGTGTAANELSTDLWRTYDLAYFAAAGVPEGHVAEAAAARQAMRGTPVIDVWIKPLETNIAAFHRLAEARPGLRRGIVSNNDGTAEQQLLDHGVCQVGPGPLPSVEILIDSAVIGVAKPDPAIFAPVLDHFGTEPHRILYVGDTYQADVVGARAAGLQVVQLDPYDLHHDYDHPRARDLAALVELLR